MAEAEHSKKQGVVSRIAKEDTQRNPVSQRKAMDLKRRLRVFAALTKDPDLTNSTHTAAPSHLSVQVQGIPCSLKAQTYK